MKTIENLKVEKTTYKKETDENGNTIKVPVTKMVARPPVVVGQGVRFGYYLIDLVFVYILAFLIGVISAFAGVFEIWDNPITSRLLGILIFVSYYFILEASFGTTLGKLILGYTVIDEYAEKPKIATLLGRNFARAVPFEAFSCLGERGWHDSWSNTYVVKNSEKAELQKLLGTFSNTKEDILD
ncbi:RDD family protein [Fluviicola taffensis]|uniref:RDD family protein n=1 Tax=Fluviicola taffensis TaxID=191579 RepID=UPI00313822A7